MFAFVCTFGPVDVKNILRNMVQKCGFRSGSKTRTFVPCCKIYYLFSDKRKMIFFSNQDKSKVIPLMTHGQISMSDLLHFRIWKRERMRHFWHLQSIRWWRTFHSIVIRKFFCSFTDTLENILITMTNR